MIGPLLHTMTDGLSRTQLVQNGERASNSQEIISMEPPPPLVRPGMRESGRIDRAPKSSERNWRGGVHNSWVFLGSTSHE